MTNNDQDHEPDDDVIRAQLPSALELYETTELANEIIRRHDSCVVIMKRPSCPEDGRQEISFVSSFDFQSLTSMCAQTHHHFWLLSQGQFPGDAIHVHT